MGAVLDEARFEDLTSELTIAGLAVLRLRRLYVDGRVKPVGKTPNSVPRPVPLTRRVLDALADLPTRIDTPLIFPGIQGGHLNLHNWRRDEWKPAVRAAGLEH